MRDLRDVLIPGTISKAMHLGKICRDAIAAGENSATLVAKAGLGAVVFSGRVESVTYKTDQGFTIGQILLSGAASSMTVSVKNENMACWLDDVVLATVPDLICIFDSQSGLPIANPDVVKGQEVTVVILPAPDAFKSEKGLSVFGPAYAGIKANFTSPLQPAL